MARQQITLCTNQLLTPSSPPGGITANGLYDLWTSATESNNNGLPSLRLIVDYKELVPTDLPGGLTVLVEVQNGGNWFPVAYQFEPYRNADQGPQRIIQLEQGADNYNDGIDSIIYVGDRTIARVSRIGGRVGGAFRVRLRLDERAFGQPAAFQQIKVSVYGELYDAAG